MKNIKNKFIPLLISIFAAVTLGLSGCMDLFDDSEVPTDRDVKYSVIYDNNGADTKTDVPVDLTEYVKGAIVTVQFDPKPEKTGNTFKGWRNSLTRDLYESDGATFTITATVTLVAEWEPNAISGGGIDMKVSWDEDPENLDLQAWIIQDQNNNYIRLECSADYKCTWYIDGEDKTSTIGDGTVSGTKIYFEWNIPADLIGDVDITLLIYDTATFKTYSRTAHVRILKN